jgi:hypothetical protein
MWDAVVRLDLTAFYAPIVVVIGGPGQAATDPQILVALWLYALSLSGGDQRASPQRSVRRTFGCAAGSR